MSSLCEPAGDGRDVVVEVEGEAEDHRLPDDEEADSEADAEAAELPFAANAGEWPSCAAAVRRG